ncbi:BON domain-containing protein [Hydrogenophaga sp.]|uniref:BON domain-containing protein n=1 Tax=Hydrogenophaga sp. TaxID=1904254 RepID=UPI0027156278|nr:BON domain-containing protein [Hydrogenophaga sp.]MDO8905733.1 BON domain-containing protein [Hydrogenophaga sp.]
MNKTLPQTRSRLLAVALTSLVALTALSACTPLLLGGAAVTSAIVVSDRRTTGAQLEDQAIELKAGNRIKDEVGSRARALVTSYNRRVLLTGEVSNERDKALIGEIVSRVENVAAVQNELEITNSPSLRERAADTVVTGRVKAAFIDVNQIPASAFKVTTERGTVYLMGRVTQREADYATQVARNTQGVRRVVRVLEIISEEELARMAPAATPAPAPAQ